MSTYYERYESPTELSEDRGAWRFDPFRRVQVWVPAKDAPAEEVGYPDACWCGATTVEACRSKDGTPTNTHADRFLPRVCKCGAALEPRRRYCAPCAEASKRASEQRSRWKMRGEPKPRMSAEECHKTWIEFKAKGLTRADAAAHLGITKGALEKAVQRHRKRMGLTEQRPPLKAVAECGSYGGYHRHLRQGEETCAECREAKSRYDREWNRRLEVA